MGFAIVAFACPTAAPDRLPNGIWGGEHIGMVVADTGATIEYDCASGSIDEPLRLDASGNFIWHGVHHIGHGGPVRIDEPPNNHAARYTGHASATKMTMTLTLTDTTYPAQTFTLSRGGTPYVFRCL